MLFDPNFQNALDVSSNCFVFASAGSGKTKTLVDRYIKLLFSGIKPREILCLTFTNNAVFEMRERISAILEKLLINKDDYIQKYAINTLGLSMDLQTIVKTSQKLFLDFQDDISDIKILTIHSFCKNILKKFPLEANIAPNFEIIDERESKILINEAKTNVLKKLCAQESDYLLKELTEVLSFQTFEALVKNICGDFSKFFEFFSINRDLDLYKEQLKTNFKLSANIEFSKEQEEFINLNF
ncbi:MAG: UvrD-helicase domain-containing protein, partial [Holosporales bacterium]|nr:UvrD-helicase domain-containing protein [Holosporales bacterium]